MKILVTGAPGTGKTSIVDYAKSVGCDNFFDTDNVKGLCEWREYKSGKAVGLVENTERSGGDEWYKTYGWYWIKPKMFELLNSVENPVICGSADNVMEFYKYFDKIVLLYLTKQDLVSNLLNPARTEPNGKDPSHHVRILKWQDKLLNTTKPFQPLLIKDNNVKQSFETISGLYKPSDSR